MDINPYVSRLVAWAKSAIVDLAKLFVISIIAVLIAGHWYERHSANWFVAMAAVWAVCLIAIWLLQRAWAMYRRSPN
jgi:hypothetical protein